MKLLEWFEKAKKEGFAIGAFNIDSLEILKGVMLAARVKKSPVIVEFSDGEIDYFGLKNAVDLVSNFKEETKAPVFLNADHQTNLERCLKAVETGGFDMVHYDGSGLELKDNIENTKKVVSAAKGKGVLVEAEVDKFSGSSEIHAEEIDLDLLKSSFTKPETATKFTEETKIDIFAPSFGNIHGIFTTQPDLELTLLSNIAERLGGTFLSLHGGSGIPKNQIADSIRVGKVVKVNVNTELRQAYRDALFEKLSEQEEHYKVYEYAEDIVRAVAAVVENKIDVFGSANKI